jgi:peptidyl-prolyl cis-trans isomerase B (cyclophilin B)
MEEPVATNKNQEREAREARDRLKRYNARQAVHTHQVKRRRRDNLFAIGGVVIVAALATATQLFYFNGGPGTAPTASPSPSAAAGASTGNVADPSVAEDRIWSGDMTINSIDLGITLDGSVAPQAVAQFVSLVKEGFYDGKICHRLTTSDTFKVLQCGSSDGTGSGKNDFSFGPLENVPDDDIYHEGTIAMARQTGNAYSMGSQFFIVYGDTSIPQGADTVRGYTIFGYITSGLDKLKSGVTDAGTADGQPDGAPKVATTIDKIVVK